MSTIAKIAVLWDVSPDPSRPAGYRQTPPIQFNRLSSTAVASQPRFGIRSNSDTPYPSREIASGYVDHFGDDFYDRIHFQYLEINLGNLLGVQERTLWVWNAFRRTRTLEALSFSAFDGIAFSGTTPPTLYKSLDLRTYTISVSLDGPAIIDADVVFDWDEGYNQAVEIAGRRVITWSWPPDWQRPIVERLEWRTDVMTSYQGQEQRRALRQNPRRYAEFYTGDNERARRVMETALYGWGARIWAMPLWWDGCNTTALAAAGSLSVYAPTATRDFKVGEPAVLFADWETYETGEVQQIYSDRIVFQRPLLATWPEGTRLYPVRSARIDGAVDLERWDGAAAFQRMRWAFEAGADYELAAGTASHNGYPVLELRPNWMQSPTLSYDRKLSIFDAGTGVRAIDDEALMPFTTQRQRHTFTSRESINDWRKLLYSLRGKQGAMYVPTWMRDFVVVSLITSNATAIDVEKTDHASLIGQSPSRKDLRIQLTSGQIFYRRITGSTNLNDTTERINISSSLGVQIQPEEIAVISYLSLVRLDSDAIDLSWWQGDTCESQISLRTFRHGI